jgi:hypothetical protein
MSKVNIKALAETSQIKSGDFLIIETLGGTRIIDYKNVTIDLANTTFASTLSALETAIGRPVDGTDVELSSNYSLIQQLTGSDSAEWTSKADTSVLYTLSSVGIGTNAPDNTLHVTNASGVTKEVVKLEQLDDDEPFIIFTGTTASDQTKSLSTDTTVGSIEGHIRVSINGTDKWIPYYATN